MSVCVSVCVCMCVCGVHACVSARVCVSMCVYLCGMMPPSLVAIALCAALICWKERVQRESSKVASLKR